MNIEIRDIDKMIFVATLPRSGSSMTCGILEKCGAFGGNTIGETPANPMGIFENRGLNQMTLRPILQEIEIKTPRGLLTLHKAGGVPKELFSSYKSDMTYGMMRQGYKGGVAYFKNGIFTFFFDRINEAFPDAVWILPNRRDDDVIKSHKRLHPEKKEMRIKREIDAYREMYNHILLTAKDRAHLLDTDKIVDGDTSHLKTIIESVGLNWNEDGVNEFISPKLWGDNPEKSEVVQQVTLAEASDEQKEELFVR